MGPREEDLDPEAAANEDVILTSGAERVAAAAVFRHALGMSSSKETVAPQALVRLGIEFKGPEAISFAKQRGRLPCMNDFHMENNTFVALDLQQQYRGDLAAAAAASGAGHDGEGKLPCPACCRFTALSKGPQFERVRKIASPEGWSYVLAWKMVCKACPGKLLAGS
jgi:hypothetical protein